MIWGMTSEQASFLLTEIYVPQILSEHKTTCRVIQAIPTDKTSWKPDPKSMGALELASHIAGSEIMFLRCIANGAFNPADGEAPKSIKTPADLLAWYEKTFASEAARVAATPGAGLVKVINFHNVFVMPAVSFAGVLLSHSTHHRGQLSAYLRPMGSKVPSIYGPSADEPMQVPAQA